MKTGTFNGKDFLWGSATAAHQVEGNTINDWTEWEKANAHRLASRRFGIPEHAVGQAQDAGNYQSGNGAQHYDYYKQDLDLAKQLGHNAYRFSIEWSRVEPAAGHFDTEQIAHYREKLQYMRQIGLEPVVTLWHFTSPLWFVARGGWLNKQNVSLFVDYVCRMEHELGDLVKYWITINEPRVYSTMAYLHAEWPPASHSLISTWRTLHNLLLAHKISYKVLKAANSNYLVSFSHNAPYNVVHKHNIFNKLVVWVLNHFLVYYELDRVKNHLDYIGLNFYFTNVVTGLKFNKSLSTDLLSDLGWRVAPQNIGPMLELVYARYKKPIIITENGIADAKDSLRSWFITQTLESCSKAMQNGVNLIGYLHWSLIDNFEWAYGFWPRFGLIEVDYQTLQRKPRPSALTYKSLIEQYSQASTSTTS